MQFFKELLKAIEFSLINGKAKFHIDFTSTFDLLDLFKNKEEEAKKKEEKEEEDKKKVEEERKIAEEEAKKKAEEEEEEKAWAEGKDPSLWNDDDEW